MVSFQRYFEKRVEELLNTNGSQVFFEALVLNNCII